MTDRVLRSRGSASHLSDFKTHSRKPLMEQKTTIESNAGKNESLDYYDVHNEPFIKERENETKWDPRFDIIARWVLAIVVGILVAIAFFLLHAGLEKLDVYKFDLVAPALQKKDYWKAYWSYLGFNIALTMTGASILVFLAPAAAGSGNVDVAGYLNGNRIPRAMSLKTFVAKMVASMLHVASSLPVGPEGPMIHIGAMIGGAFAQSHSRTLGFGLPFLNRFHTDKDRRDFISLGAACGVAAAFNAPIGGILFALEEASSFWAPSLTARSFLASIISVSMASLLQSQLHSKDSSSVPKEYRWSAVFEFSSATITAKDLLLFVILSVIAGLLAVVFLKMIEWSGRFRAWLVSVPNPNSTYSVLPDEDEEPEIEVRGGGGGGGLRSRSRGGMGSEVALADLSPSSGGFQDSHSSSEEPRYVQPDPMKPTPKYACKRLADVLVLTVVATTVCFLLSFSSECKIPPQESQGTEAVAQEKSLGHWSCPTVLFNGTEVQQFNPASSLTFVTQADQLRNLFLRGGPLGDTPVFGVSVLLIFTVCFLVLTTITTGAAVSGGLLVPNLVLGAATGRLFCLVAMAVTGLHLDVSMYAVIGAAAFMGGVTRMQISLTVILLEVTHNLDILPGIMMAVMLGNWVGDACFTVSLQHLMLHIRGIPFLDSEPPRQLQLFTVADMMPKQDDGKNVACHMFSLTPTVDQVVAVLNDCQHNGFPVVPNNPPGTNDRTLKGLVLRSQLVVLLQHRVWMGREMMQNKNLRTFRSQLYPNKKVAEFMLSPEDRNERIDLGLYMNRSCISVPATFSAYMAVRLFRGLGIRHLVVCDEHNQVEGVITRKDIYKLMNQLHHQPHPDPNRHLLWSRVDDDENSRTRKKDSGAGLSAGLSGVHAPPNPNPSPSRHIINSPINSGEDHSPRSVSSKRDRGQEGREGGVIVDGNLGTKGGGTISYSEFTYNNTKNPDNSVPIGVSSLTRDQSLSQFARNT